MLTPDGCRARQQRFLQRLDAAAIPAVVVSDPCDIYYLTGLLPESPVAEMPSLLLLGPEIPSCLVTPVTEGEAVVDERIDYPFHVLYTLNPDNTGRLGERAAELIRRHQGLGCLGFQTEALPHSVAVCLQDAGSPRAWEPVDDLLRTLQLHKDPDEVACLRRAARALLAGYARAREVIRPGVSELEVLTECQQAAQRATGAVHFYNGDFRSGEFGGLARNRAVEAGELYIIDSWCRVDGYWADLSRAWVVGGEPTDAQASVYEHVAAVLARVPGMLRLGRDTRDLWAEVDALLREHSLLADSGLTHHAGHGIGLRPHEGPDLNRDRGGMLEAGNVVCCEPGGYHPSLRRGVRLENMFLLTEDGVEVLSEAPLSPYPAP